MLAESWRSVRLRSSSACCWRSLACRTRLWIAPQLQTGTLSVTTAEAAEVHLAERVAVSEVARVEAVEVIEAQRRIVAAARRRDAFVLEVKIQTRDVEFGAGCLGGRFDGLALRQRESRLQIVGDTERLCKVRKDEDGQGDFGLFDGELGVLFVAPALVHLDLGLDDIGLG